MQTWSKILFGAVLGLSVAGLLPAQDEGPNKDVGETVTKPRSKDGDNTGDLPKIPSKLSDKNKADVADDSTAFKVETNVVNVDVAVLDNQGHFIPNIPKGNFRVLEDNVPQQISNFSMGEAPLTVCMVIEFSNRFQQFWSEP